MTDPSNLHLGLLYLVHLLVNVDGTLDDSEREALDRIIRKEGIAQSTVAEFEQQVGAKTERQIYQHGIELLNQCTDDEKLRAFVHLYKLSEVDGRVHVKEVRLLLYSIKMAGVEFNDVVARARATA
jgi:uncharacterized tellurite resistance protein B-like protein